MKKLLAMVLALVMTLSLAVSASAVKADEKINEDYAEAVAVLNGMGVFKGYEDGSFKPENNITRAEVAAIIYRIYTGDVAKNDKSGLYASYNKFTDMAGAGWAAGYIGYCSNAELVKGYPNGTFQPSGNITGYEVLAMILRAVGYDKNGEFTGADWALNVAKYAEQLKILDNVAKTTNLGAPATRELVAEILFRAINVPMVTYTAAFGYQNVGLNGDKDNKLFKNNVTLGKKNFELDYTKIDSTYGRPATKWTYNCGDKKTVVEDQPLASYLVATAGCDIIKDTKVKSVDATWTDGKKAEGTVKIADTSKKDYGCQGTVLEVYADRLVYIHTYLGEVSKVYEADKDKNDHGSDACIDVKLYNFEGKYEKHVEIDGFKKYDAVLVTVDYDKDSGKYEIVTVEAAASKDLELTKITGVSKSTGDVQDILKLDGEETTVNCTASIIDNLDVLVLGETYTFYYDANGNVIGVAEYAPAASYVVIDELWKNVSDGKEDIRATLIGAADAKAIEKAPVSKISVGQLDETDVRMHEELNRDFYYTLMQYTVNSKDQYVLTAVGKRVRNATYTSGDRYFSGRDGNQGTTNVYMNKDTVILFQSTESPNGTFTNYTYKTLPSFKAIHVDYVVSDTDGYADVVYILGSLQNDRYVFVPDVTSTKDVCTIEKVKGEDDVYELTLAVKELNDKGELVDSTVVIRNKFAGLDFPNVDASAFGATHAGLYAVDSWGDYAVLRALPLYNVYDLKKVGDDTTSIHVRNGSELDLISFDEDDSPLYTRWTGDFTSVEAGYATKVEKVAKASSEEMNRGDLVYVQYDKDGENVVAVYDMYYEVDVDFADGYKTIDKDAKIDAPAMYVGKDAEDFTVSVSKNVAPSTDDEAFADPTAKDAEGNDIEHNVARTFTFKATGKVTDDITVNLAADICADAWLELNANVQSQNLSVTLNQAENEVVITTDNGTIKVNDVAAFLKAAGTHNQGYQFFNNTTKNPVDKNNSVDDFEITNLFIIVTAENGKEVKYTFTAGV